MGRGSGSGGDSAQIQGERIVSAVRNSTNAPTGAAAEQRVINNLAASVRRLQADTGASLSRATTDVIRAFRRGA